MDGMMGIIGMWIMFGLGCVLGFCLSQGTQYRRFSKEYHKIRDEWQEIGAEYKRMRELAMRLQQDDNYTTQPDSHKDKLH